MLDGEDNETLVLSSVYYCVAEDSHASTTVLHQEQLYTARALY